MKSLAEVKRTLTTGRCVLVTDHRYPELEGERVVLKTQTKGVYLSFPEGHPKASATNGSWVQWPKVADLTFLPNGSVRINDLCTIEVS